MQNLLRCILSVISVAIQVQDVLPVVCPVTGTTLMNICCGVNLLLIGSLVCGLQHVSQLEFMYVCCACYPNIFYLLKFW